MARPSPGGLYRLVAQQETRRAVDGGRQAAQSVGLDVAATPARRRHRRRRRRRRRRPIDGVDRRHQVAQLQLVQVGLPPVSQSARHRRVPNAKHFSLSTVPKKKKRPKLALLPVACGRAARCFDIFGVFWLRTTPTRVPKVSQKEPKTIWKHRSWRWPHFLIACLTCFISLLLLSLFFFVVIPLFFFVAFFFAVPVK